MNINGIAALRCWSVNVTLSDQTYTIPVLPALSWIMAIRKGSWLAVVPGLLDQAEAFDDALDRGAIDPEDCIRSAQEAITVASGLPWWTASRLVSVSVDQCGVTGALVLAGIDASVVPLGAYVAATYRIVTDGADKNELARIDRILNERPAGLATDQLYDEQAASDAFMMAARARGMQVD